MSRAPRSAARVTLLTAMCVLAGTAGGRAALRPSSECPAPVGLARVADSSDGCVYRWSRAGRELATLWQPGRPPVASDRIFIRVVDGAVPEVEVLQVMGQRSVAPSPRIWWPPEGLESAGAEEWRRPGIEAPLPEAGESWQEPWSGDAEAVLSPALDGPASFLGVEPLWFDGTQTWLPVRIHPDSYDFERGIETRATALTLVVRWPEASEPDEETVAPVDAGSWAEANQQVPAPDSPGLDGNPDLKLTLAADGFYSVSPANLTGQGFNLGTLDPRTLKVSIGGTQVAAVLTGNGDGTFDASERLLFHAQRATSAFTTFPYRYANVARLTSGGANGLRASSRAGAPVGAPVGSFSTTLSIDDNAILTSDSVDDQGDYYHREEVLGSGIGFSDSVLDIPFPTPRAVTTGGGASLTVRLFGRRFTGPPVSDGPHHTEIRWNNVLKDNVTWNGLTNYLVTIPLTASEVLTSGNTLRVTLRNDTALNTIYVNRADLTYVRSFTADGNRLEFSGTGPADYVVRGFTTSDPEVWDVTAPLAPVQITGGTIAADGLGGFQVAFRETLAGSRSYRVLTPAARVTPSALTVDAPSSLASPTNGADWILIRPAAFAAALAPLVAHRAAQGLRTFAVDPIDIYDEFSFSLPTPTALHDFVAYAVANWEAPAPQFVVLGGDANQDFFDYLGYGNNHVPTSYQSIVGKFGARMTANDHAFSTVVGTDQLADIAVGRLPGRTSPQIEAMVDKIIAYETDPPVADLNRGVLLVADEVDVGGPFDYPAASDARCADLAGTGTSCLAVDYPGQGNEAATRAAITNQLNMGTLLMNYYGGANARKWGFTILRRPRRLGFYDRIEIDALGNDAWPFVVSHSTQNACSRAHGQRRCCRRRGQRHRELHATSRRRCGGGLRPGRGRHPRSHGDLRGSAVRRDLHAAHRSRGRGLAGGTQPGHRRSGGARGFHAAPQLLRRPGSRPRARLGCRWRAQPLGLRRSQPGPVRRARSRAAHPGVQPCRHPLVGRRAPRRGLQRAARRAAGGRVMGLEPGLCRDGGRRPGARRVRHAGERGDLVLPGDRRERLR